MKFIPILFNTDMVKAVQDGTKTQTRRIVGMPNEFQHTGYCYHKNSIDHIKVTVQENDGSEDGEETYQILEPKAQKGDVFWVRENWATDPIYDNEKPSELDEDFSIIYYKADYDEGDFKGLKTRPSIFMPKWMCRLFLEVVDVRIERLQDISKYDARREGIKKKRVNYDKVGLLINYYNYSSGIFGRLSAIDSFKSLWQKINGKESWKSNPCVWVYEFKVIDKPNGFEW